MNQIKKNEAAVALAQKKINYNAISLQRTLNDTFPVDYFEGNLTFPLATSNDTKQFSHSAFQDFWLNRMNNNILLIFYSVIVFSMITLTIGRSLTFYRFCNKASIRLHNNMFYKIVYATMRFFNANPSGRILNRFSKDMNQVDEVLPMALLDTLQVSFTCRKVAHL